MVSLFDYTQYLKGFKTIPTPPLTAPFFLPMMNTHSSYINKFLDKIQPKRHTKNLDKCYFNLNEKNCFKLLKVTCMWKTL